MGSTTLAEGVKDRLNLLDLDFVFEAERLAFPRDKITSADTVAVSVFKGPRTSNEVTRGHWQKSYSVFVVVQKKLPPELNRQLEESDRLTDFIEAIEADFEADGVVGDYRLDRFDETIDRLPFNVEMIRDTGLFSAFFGLVFTD